MYLLKEKERKPTARALPTIELLDSAPDAWDAFVQGHPQGTFFHLSDWKTIFESYFKIKTYYLVSKTDAEITGVLPLARVKSRLFSDALISTPFGVYGGVLAQTEEDKNALIEAASILARDLKVDYLELRQQDPVCEVGVGQSLYVTFKKELDPDPEKNLLAIPRKQRAMVRKAVNQGLTYKVDRDVKTFYRLYSESVRNLGTPVQSRAYFECLIEQFGDRADILTVYHQNQAVSSVLNFYYQDQVLPYFGGGGEAARLTSANDFMYWSLMTHALSKGCTVFDFGRSKVDTGSYRFKKHWGFEPTPLHYRILPVTKTEIPNINPTNPKYQRKIALWKKLPLTVANTLGPIIARRIG